MKKLSSQDLLLTNAKHIHMIGIGGSGMCPIAEILHSKGHILSGSDNNESDPLKRVRSLGIKVTMGHLPENVEDAELVVYSAAISEDNPELVRAHELSIPTMERSKLLGALTRHYDNVVGVCGTHGKTTTSSMITQILYLNKMDPSAVIGGKLPIINSNGLCGKSDIFVCESCEFVNTFLQMSPDISVLLNIDNVGRGCGCGFERVFLRVPRQGYVLFLHIGHGRDVLHGQRLHRGSLSLVNLCVVFQYGLVDGTGDEELAVGVVRHQHVGIVLVREQFQNH